MPTARRCSTGSQRSSRSETRTDPGLTGQLRLGEFPLPDVSNLVGNTEMMLGIWGKTTKMLWKLVAGLGCMDETAFQRNDPCAGATG
jgi:hypothetical protein